VTTSAGGEIAPVRGKGGGDTSWADANLTGQKRRKFTRSIQLIEIDGVDLKHR
jgi:hypothetical protein